MSNKTKTDKRDFFSFLKKPSFIVPSCIVALLLVLFSIFCYKAYERNLENQKIMDELSIKNEELSETIENERVDYINLLALYTQATGRLDNIDIERATLEETINQYYIANETLVEALSDKESEIAEQELLISNKQDIIDGKQNAIVELQNTIDDLNIIIDKNNNLLDNLVTRFSAGIGTVYALLYKSCLYQLDDAKNEINETLTNTADIQKYCSQIDQAEKTIISLLEYYPDEKPVEGEITSRYGKRTYKNNGKTISGFHNGLDISYSPTLDIKSAAAGTVVEANTVDNGGLGLYIKIDHGNGYQTVYGHLAEVNVKVGQKVKKGEYIGVMGNSGAATGIHLHIEVFSEGKRMDPLEFFDYE